MGHCSGKKGIRKIQFEGEAVQRYKSLGVILVEVVGMGNQEGGVLHPHHASVHFKHEAYAGDIPAGGE